MSLRPFPTQAVAACPPCCSEARRDAQGCQWVDDMLAICGGLLFLGVGRLEIAAMAPCRRRRRTLERPVEAPTAERDDPHVMEYPPLQLVRA